MRALTTFFLSGFLATVLVCGSSRAEEPKSSVGINLAPLADYSREWAFVDVFKQSRPWIESQQGKIKYDEQGYPILGPKQSVLTVMVRELKGHYPGGTYVATYSGAGYVRMDQFDVKRVRARPRHIEADVVPNDGGLQLQIVDTDPKNIVRNIHVWMPGFERKHATFHPLFYRRLEPFGVIRFMDWQGTNHSKQAKWSQRAKPGDARYTTPAGVPIEMMIELANLRKADPWFCMPHLADDEYVREFAKLVKARLHDGLKVYVEYSNEVWNGAFGQSHWARAQGRKLRLGDPDGARFYAERSVQIFKIWEEVFGGRDRLVRVLGSQFVNTWLSEQILTWKDAYKHADALAIAPYFGYEFGDPQHVSKTLRLSTEQLLKKLDEEVSGKNRELMEDQERIARKYKLQLIAYEGGQHLAGGGGFENNEALTRLFVSANRDPQMYELYRKHLKNWRDSNGGVYCTYNYVSSPGKWGSWGILEYQDQKETEAPKYRALIEFAKKKSE
jgi:hypothetical protein